MKKNTKPKLYHQSFLEKCLIKTLAHSWMSNAEIKARLGLLEGDVPGPDKWKELEILYRCFREEFPEERPDAKIRPVTPINARYLKTVDAILDHLTHLTQSPIITKYFSEHLQVAQWLTANNSLKALIAAKNAAIKNTLQLEDDDDDISMENLFTETTLVEKHGIHAELIKYVTNVADIWSYIYPFYFKRNKTNPATLFVVTSVGTHSTSNIKTSVNVAIGSTKLPEIGEEFLFYENGAPVKYGFDGKDGRTYWGWVFKISNGTVLRFWMSRVVGYDIFEKEIWEQRAKVTIRLHPNIPKGYQVVSATHADLLGNASHAL